MDKKTSFKAYWKSLKWGDRMVWILGFVFMIGSISVIDFDKLTLIEEIALFLGYIGAFVLGFATYHNVEWEKKVKGENHE